MRAIVLLAFLSHSLYSVEYISRFVSDITIQPDATLSITETITVHAQGDHIKRGIVREFPTIYTTWWGKETTIPFVLKEVKRDGIDEPYHIEYASNGIEIYIGKKDVFLSPGTYTFTISYATARQLGFFPAYDELAWNVNGAGWQLPIHRIQANVHLPYVIPIDHVHTHAYTGFMGDTGSDYSVTALEDHTLIFSTTRPYKSFENMTIVLTWPKGYIPEPTITQRLYWWFLDMRGLIVLISILLLTLMYFLALSFRSRASLRQYTVIPRFYPPEHMSPSVMRTIMRRSYDATALSAELIAMAVNGYLKIIYAKGWWSGNYYLEKDTIGESAIVLHKKLFDILFAHANRVDLNISAKNKIHQLNTYVSMHVQAETAQYFKSYTEQIVGGLGVSFFGMLFVWYIFPALLFPVIGAVGILIIFVAIVHKFFLHYYTIQGQKIKAEIEGFALFLSTTEIERMKVIGTPPNRTPALYETYLPYAIALGLEKQWTAQFVPIFEKMKAAGNPYMPSWQVGPPGFSVITHPSLFVSQFSRTMSSTISAAQSAPGSRTSYPGGGGSSGSGGGGGGGKGW